MTTFQHPHHNPVIASLVEAMGQDLVNLSNQLESLQALAEKNISLGETRGLTTDEYEALYAAAYQLCNEGEFQHALPIAMQLCLHHGRDPRYFFMAGACFQQLRVHESAAAMYGMALKHDGTHITAMYRLGECYKAMAMNEKAIAAFESTIDLGRVSANYRSLQILAENELEQLRNLEGATAPAKSSKDTRVQIDNKSTTTLCLKVKPEQIGPLYPPLRAAYSLEIATIVAGAITTIVGVVNQSEELIVDGAITTIVGSAALLGTLGVHARLWNKISNSTPEEVANNIGHIIV